MAFIPAEFNMFENRKKDQNMFENRKKDKKILQSGSNCYMIPTTVCFLPVVYFI